MQQDPSQQPYQPYQQPPQYPQQQPYYGPPPQQPPRKRRTWLWIVLAVLAVLVCACAGISYAVSRAGQVVTSTVNNTPSSSSPSTTPVATTQPTGTWTTVQQFKGNGTKKTATFTVPDTWRIAWKCNPASFFGGSYNLVVSVHNADGSIADVAINTICKKGNIADSTIEHMGGSIYLGIASEGSWTVQVQVQK